MEQFRELFVAVALTAAYQIGFDDADAAPYNEYVPHTPRTKYEQRKANW